MSTWIESHTALSHHPKVSRLRKELNVTKPHAIGVLHMLWWWAIEYAQDGIIHREREGDVADACSWNGDCNALLTALHSAGWLDEHEAGWEIHDWWEYAGKLLAQRAREREATKERVKRFRDRNAVTLASVTPLQGSCNAVSNGHVTLHSTVPNSTYSTEESKTRATAPRKRVAVTESAEFLAFYTAYPLHKGRSEAWKAWQKVNPDGSLTSRIMEGMRLYCEEVRGKDPQYIKHPGPWLNSKRWEDEPSPVGHNGHDTGLFAAVQVDETQRAAYRHFGHVYPLWAEDHMQPLDCNPLQGRPYPTEFMSACADRGPDGVRKRYGWRQNEHSRPEEGCQRVSA